MLLLLHIIVTYIKENVITKLQKLNSPPRNPRVGSKSPTLFVKKPLSMGDLLPACKIFIERPDCTHFVLWNMSNCLCECHTFTNVLLHKLQTFSFCRLFLLYFLICFFKVSACTKTLLHFIHLCVTSFI